MARTGPRNPYVTVGEVLVWLLFFALLVPAGVVGWAIGHSTKSGTRTVTQTVTAAAAPPTSTTAAPTTTAAKTTSTAPAAATTSVAVAAGAPTHPSTVALRIDRYELRIQGRANYVAKCGGCRSSFVSAGNAHTGRSRLFHRRAGDSPWSGFVRPISLR